MTGVIPTDPARLGPVTGQVAGNDHTTIVVYGLGPDMTDHLDWVTAHRDGLRAGLAEHGAVLIRDLPADLDLFDRIVRVVGGEPLRYTERSTPRTSVTESIYTSTEYPADQPLPMHNENSYSDTWPGHLFFFCDTAAATGGATPIANSRAVFRAVPADVRERFAAGVVYARAFREGLGLSWQESFQTDDPAEVEDYCARHGMAYEWTEEGLRTRHHRPAHQTEPLTGEQVWFNQANLFHVTSLDEEVREALLMLYGEADLPRNAYLADGSPIAPADLAAVKAAYDETSYAFPWREGDLMIINNMLCAHGREPYTGARRILVAMTA
ncbi:TauD/TfdA family dioxygenase [Microtetraspora sp. AC03309]|uniref:TauD/TfdA family dioxygenase n=1 Tax=Microtetraspora sp. AC03309 TaxID=2779376 RepID=UPI001E4AAD56|nr:TauD/TfdA family dioxygenase [Microtetraspora sp. AC03309]MCC5575693.1 TauD/TfdA family dioxygenase [Microtetraspora sp. AC03309]